MKKFTVLDGAALVVWLLPIAYMVYIYPTLPKIIPVHWGLNGTADRYGNKSEMFTIEAILIFVSALVYLLMKFLPSIDPKKKVKFGESTFQKLGFGMVIFITALNIVITYATAQHGFEVNKLVLPLVGLLFVFIGNIMNNIKPNYFAGFKTPWALENEDNWRATHHLASRVWFAGGIIITVSTLFLNPEAGGILLTCAALVMVFIPFIYSYLYFKKQQAN